MKQQRWHLLAIALLITALATACATDDVTITSEPTPEQLPFETPISEQNTAQARVQLDAARTHWESLEPFAYTLVLGDQVRWEMEIDIDESGIAVSERLLVSDGATFFAERSVDEVFDSIDGALSKFEQGALTVPGPDACGNHFNAQFDNTLGSPTYFDTLGPCEDGLGLRIQVRPITE